MKTIKVTEGTHKQLIELQSYLYNEQGIKYSLNEIISMSTAKQALRIAVMKQHEKK